MYCFGCIQGLLACPFCKKIIVGWMPHPKPTQFIAVLGVVVDDAPSARCHSVIPELTGDRREHLCHDKKTTVTTTRTMEPI